jgi:IclR family transcriptional regulator, KDG regulon repressor
VSDAALTTVQNAARLLKAFLSRDELLGPSELGRRLGLGKSTVHRLLTTLTAEGLLEQDQRTGGYRLGIVMFELGEAVRVHMDLHAAAAPVLGMLREETRETAQVGVLDRGEVVYVDRLESSYTLRLFTETGRRVPAHCSSSGKVLLAFLPEQARADLLDGRPLPALTPDTITDPVALSAELARVRARGWAEAVNEREMGVASIAAPVRDHRGDVVAAISIGAPIIRLGAAQRRRLARPVMEAGDAVSRRLGWTAPATAPPTTGPPTTVPPTTGPRGATTTGRPAHADR